jgi:hypothetical protein
LEPAFATKTFPKLEPNFVAQKSLQKLLILYSFFPELIISKPYGVPKSHRQKSPSPSSQAHSKFF